MEASVDAAKQGWLTVYSITEREGSDRAFWTKVGAAFKNRDGSFNVRLDALPTNGKLHMRYEDPSRARPARPDVGHDRGHDRGHTVEIDEVRS